MVTRLMVCVLCAYVSSAITARADVVVDWNVITAETVGKAVGAGRPAQATGLDFAMVHAAIHDAIQAIEKRFDPYHVVIPGAKGSPVAAAAKAAHDVLARLFPEQSASLDASYDKYLSSHAISRDDPGVLVGELAAKGILARRENDGSFPLAFPAFTGGTNVGMWRPTPPQQASMAVPWMGAVKPFTLNSASRFRAEPPPRLDSSRYATDYIEVKALGAAKGSRTAQQTDLAYFWAANYGAVWNQVLRDLATAHAKTIGDSARLFALANIATADALVSAWESKRHYVIWRPVTAIQEGETDGNPRTIGDPSWQPLIPTPPYPDYVSGANVVTAAMTRSLALFFGTENMTFTVTNDATQGNQKTRRYSRFSDASDEVVVARIYEGIHFRFADEAAQRQGRDVAKWVLDRFLRPVRD